MATENRTVQTKRERQLSILLNILVFNAKQIVSLAETCHERADRGSGEKAAHYAVLRTAEHMLLCARVGLGDDIHEVAEMLFSSEAADVRPDLFPAEGSAA